MYWWVWRFADKSANLRGSLPQAFQTNPQHADDPMWLDQVRYFCFSGGGLRGLAFVGVYRFLEHLFRQRNKNLLVEAEGFAGASAGAFFATLLTLGCTVDEAEAHMLAAPFETLVNHMSLLSVMQSWGVVPHDFLAQYIRQVIETQGYDPQITFSDLHHQTGKHLVLSVARLDDATVHYADHLTFPHTPVWQMLTASMGIPLLFTPVQIDGVCYVDGGLLDNLPMVFPVDQSAGFLLTRPRRARIPNFKAYVLAVLYICLDFLEKKALHRLPLAHRHRVIRINTGRFQSLDVTLTPRDKQTLITLGQTEMTRQFRGLMLKDVVCLLWWCRFLQQVQQGL